MQNRKRPHQGGKNAPASSDEGERDLSAETRRRQTRVSEREAARQELIHRIEAAFNDVQLDDGLSLHQGRAIDNYEPDAAVAMAHGYDTEARWQDISDQTVHELSDALTFLDAKGLRFYLPRFMLFALQNYMMRGYADSWAHEAALNNARRLDSPDMHLMSTAQREVIQAFLDFFDSEG